MVNAMTTWKSIPVYMCWTGALILLGAISIGCQQAGDRETIPMQQITDPIAHGRMTYETYCMSCHGEKAKGNGPVAEILAVPPADLTRLSYANNGVFPATKVYEQIDGREDIRAHGTREMPVWGNIWSEIDGVPQPEEQMEKQISELVEYLRSLQE